MAALPLASAWKVLWLTLCLHSYGVSSYTGELDSGGPPRPASCMVPLETNEEHNLLQHVEQDVASAELARSPAPIPFGTESKAYKAGGTQVSNVDMDADSFWRDFGIHMKAGQKRKGGPFQYAWKAFQEKAFAAELKQRAEVAVAQKKATFDLLTLDAWAEGTLTFLQHLDAAIAYYEKTMPEIKFMKKNNPGANFGDGDTKGGGGAAGRPFESLNSAGLPLKMKDLANQFVTGLKQSVSRPDLWDFRPQKGYCLHIVK